MTEEVVSLECPRCGAPVGRNDRMCGHCKSPMYVKSVKEVTTVIRSGKQDKNPQQIMNDYINFYNKKLLQDESHLDSLLALGLFYIETKQGEKAIEKLEKAKDLSPATASIYFYLALAMVFKRRPRVMTKMEVQKVEEQLEAVRCIDSEFGVADLLLGAVKYDFYIMNGLRPPAPGHDELIKSARNKYLDPDDAAKMLELCSFSGNPVLRNMQEMDL